MSKKVSKKVLKKQQEAVDEANREALERCAPIAKKVLEIALKHDLTPGDKQDIRTDEYLAASEEIMRLFVDNDMYWDDRVMVRGLALQIVDLLTNIVNSDLERTYNKSVSQMFDVPTISDLRFGKLDKIIQNREKMAEFIKEIAPNEATTE